jgi:predicted nucleotidyltransferase
MIPYPLLRAEIARHPYPLLFATISGAHLYGFPSPDSDYDLRGVHILPAAEALSLLPRRETIMVDGIRDSIELDLVTHDALKFFRMLLKRNGYVLEQVFSPLIVEARQEHDELKSIARTCITRHHSHHYLGFAATQWNLFRKEDPPRIKPLPYVYRVLCTGIHLMRTGEVEANLVTLNHEFRLPFVPDLIARKSGGPEQGTLDCAEIPLHESEYLRLVAALEQAAADSSLPTETAAHHALNDLLIRLRLHALPITGDARAATDNME